MLLQRVDAEKSRHRTFITSDIRLQINEMNQKVKEEWEKKQAEAEKLKKPSEVCSELIIYVLIFTTAHRHYKICFFFCCRVKKVMVELTVRRRKKIIVQRA